MHTQSTKVRGDECDFVNEEMGLGFFSNLPHLNFLEHCATQEE